MTHLTYTLFFATLLAAAAALTGQHSTRERVYLGIYWLSTAMASVAAGAWIMHWVHG